MILIEYSRLKSEMNLIESRLKLQAQDILKFPYSK